MSSKSFPYRFGILYSLSVVFFRYRGVFSKKCCGFSMSKHVKFLAKNVFQKAGPNTEKYGPRSVYGFLRTVCRPIRMQDSLKSYNNKYYEATNMKFCIQVRSVFLLNFASYLDLIKEYFLLL